MKTINKIGMVLFITAILAVGIFAIYLQVFCGGSEESITWIGTFATLAILIAALFMWKEQEGNKMPRVKLNEPDRRDAELRAVISAGMERSRYKDLRSLAAAVGISEPTLSKWLQNPRLFRHGTMIDILDLLKVSEVDRQKIL